MMLSRFACLYRLNRHSSKLNFYNDFNKWSISSVSFQIRYFASELGFQSRSGLLVDNSIRDFPFYSKIQTTLSHRDFNNDASYTSKQQTVEKQIADALSCGNTELLVNLVETSLSSNVPISGNILHSALSRLASLGYYEEIERWTPLILQRLSPPASSQKPQGTISVRQLYIIRAYAAFYGGHLKDHLERCISEYMSIPSASSIKDHFHFNKVFSPMASSLTRIQLEESLVILFALLHAGSESALVCRTLRQQSILRIYDVLELGLLEWRALVLIGKFFPAETCLRYILRRCYYRTLHMVSPRQETAPKVDDSRLFASIKPVQPLAPMSESARLARTENNKIEKRREHREMLNFVIEHSGNTHVGPFGYHMSRALSALILHDVHLFPAEKTCVAGPSASDADADAGPPPPVRADPIAELVPRVNTAAVFTHLLRPERIFYDATQFDTILARAMQQLLHIRVQERNWKALRSLLAGLYHRQYQRLLPLLDPVQFSVLARRTFIEATASYKTDPALALVLRSSASAESLKNPSPSGSLGTAATKSSRAARSGFKLAVVEQRIDAATATARTPAATAASRANGNERVNAPAAASAAVGSAADGDDLHNCNILFKKIFPIINSF